MARRKYQRRSHLAEAYNRQGPVGQFFWGIVWIIAFVFAMVMYFSH